MWLRDLIDQSLRWAQLAIRDGLRVDAVGDATQLFPILRYRSQKWTRKSLGEALAQINPRTHPHPSCACIADVRSSASHISFDVRSAWRAPLEARSQ